MAKHETASETRYNGLLIRGVRNYESEEARRAAAYEFARRGYNAIEDVAGTDAYPYGLYVAIVPRLFFYCDELDNPIEELEEVVA